MTRQRAIAVGTSLLVLVCLVAWALWPAPARPNVLVLLWDTVRADRMSLYGYDRPTTPKIDAWAKRGLVFEHAWAPAVWTVPSHGSLFTGLPVRTHGANVNYRWLDGHHTTFAEWFGQHGYDTYAFSANPNLTPTHMNLLQGFDTVELSWTPPWKGPVRRHTRDKLLAADRSSEISPAWPGARETGRAAQAFNAAPVGHQAFVGWASKRKRPWLAYLSYMEAHKPRVPSQKAREQVASAEVIARSLQVDQGLVRQLGAMAGGPGYDAAEREALDATYDATLVDLDDATAALLEDLEARGWLDNTIVVLTSDHGEQLGEHGHYLHKTGLFEPITHVPLIVWGPGIDPGRVPRTVSNQQLFATLDALAGLPDPDTGLLTRSLLDDTEAPVHAELVATAAHPFRPIRHLPGVDITPFLRTIEAVADHGRKLIRYSDGERFLYDLTADPTEQTNLAPGDGALDALLDAFAAETPVYDPGQRGPGDGPKGAGPKRREMLEVLGYVEP